MHAQRLPGFGYAWIYANFDEHNFTSSLSLVFTTKPGTTLQSHSYQMDCKYNAGRPAKDYKDKDGTWTGAKTIRRHHRIDMTIVGFKPYSFYVDLHIFPRDPLLAI